MAAKRKGKHPCGIEGCEQDRTRPDRPVCRAHYEARDTLRPLTEPQRKYIDYLMGANGFETEGDMLQAVAKVGRTLHSNNSAAFVMRAVDIVGVRCLDDLNVLHGIKVITSLQRWQWLLEESEAGTKGGAENNIEEV